MDITGTRENVCLELKSVKSRKRGITVILNRKYGVPINIIKI